MNGDLISTMSREERLCAQLEGIEIALLHALNQLDELANPSVAMLIDKARSIAITALRERT